MHNDEGTPVAVDGEEPKSTTSDAPEVGAAATHGPGLSRGVMIGVIVAVVVIAGLLFAASVFMSRVPDVAGKSVADATAALEHVGFKIGEVVEVTDYDEAKYAANTVVGTSGGSFGLARDGATIDLKVASGAVLAVVNGEEIYAIAIDRQIAAMRVQNETAFTGDNGAERENEFKKLLLSGMIDATLVSQAAAEAGVVVEDAEVDTQVELMRSAFDSEDKFLESIGGAGLDVEALRIQLSDQLLTQKLIATLDVKTDVSDKDVETFYRNNKQLFPDRKLDEVREQVREIVLQQRRADAYQAYVAELRATAEIEIKDQALTGPLNPQ